MFKIPTTDKITIAKFNSKPNIKTIKKVKAKFGSSLSERILRDWIESMFALLKLTCPLYSQTNFKLYQQYKIKILEPKFSRIVDLKVEIIYPNYPSPVETFIEFDGLKQHKLSKQKDKKLDSFIQLTDKRLIRISQKTFISERKLSTLLITILSLDPEQTGIKRIYSTSELKRLIENNQKYNQILDILSAIVIS